MSKKIIVIAALIAAIAGGYWFSQQSSNGGGGADSGLLQRVPADTVLFAGGLQTMPYVNPYDAQTIKAFKDSMSDSVKQLEEISGGSDSPAATVLTNLYMGLADHFYSANVTEINDFAIYSLGVYPVAVWKSTDIQAFTNQLNKIESDNSIAPRSFTLGQAELREYDINQEVPFKMYVAINGDTVSLTAMSNNQDLLKLFAGVDFPEQNLANNNKLQTVTKTHKLLPFAFGYLDVDAIMTSLTSSEDNLLKQTLQEVSEGKAMSEIDGDACFADAAKITAKWPRMVFGYRTFEYQSNPMVMDAAFIFEHTDPKLLNSLKSIIGSVPEYSLEHDIMSMGVGINIDNIATFLADVRKDLMNESYQCEGLVEMQQQAAQNDPAMLAMGTQMVAGLQGVSIHMTSFDMAAVQAGDMTKFEGMAVITASNPQNLIMAAGNFYPPLAQMNLEVDGEAKELTLPMGPKASVAMSASAITLQFGQSEETKSRIADIHQGKGISPSLMRSGMDFSTYFKMLEPMMAGAIAQSSDKDAEQLKMMIEVFEKMNLKFVYDFSVEDSGIVFNFKASMNNTAN
jgi:hypothetical protein